MIQISIKNLYKSFPTGDTQDFHALRNIHLEIPKNSLTILKGISGSGKSTLLSIIANLQKPTSGEVRIDGEAISKLPDLHASHFRAAKIGFIPQHFNLFDTLSVEENISLSLIPLGFSPKEIQQKTQNALALAHISHKQHTQVRNLSGGEKQRTAIARALVSEPSIILCDEPTANLDLDNAQKFITILEELKALGKTIIVATHDPLFDTLSFVDSVVHIHDGTI